MNNIIVFDVSGSMEGERYNNCKKIVDIFKNEYDLWLFGDDVEIIKNCSKMGDVKCNQGTDIDNLLKKLHCFLSCVEGIYVTILTDNQANYNVGYHKNKFLSIRNKNHEYVIYDICGTNMETLIEVFGSDYCKVTKNYDELNNLIMKLQITIQEDKKIIKQFDNINVNICKLIDNIDTLTEINTKLEIEETKISSNVKLAVNNANNTIKNNSTNLQKILNEKSNILDHITELITFIEECQNVKVEYDSLKSKILNINTSIGKLETVINKEKLSNNFSQNKINEYNSKIIKKRKEKEEYTINLDNLIKKNNDRIKIMDDFEVQLNSLHDKLIQLSL